MVDIVRYTADKKAEWDAFVEDSKNGTFLFLRDYMEYHADRFEDHSLMYYKDGRLLALLPANKDGEVLWSHKGLTYGGFVLNMKAHATEVGEMFDVTLEHLRAAGIKEWYYKQIPTVYHQFPAEEDSYWLWRNGAEVVECNMMSAISPKQGYFFSPSRRNNSNKLKKEGWCAIEGDDEDKVDMLEDLWKILTENLKEKYNSKPVHTIEEIKRLQALFPENIKVYAVIDKEGVMEGGTLMYVAGQVARFQYMSASPRGKKKKVLDLLITELVRAYAWESDILYLDFGTSMEDDAIHLKEPLIAQKEGFGARGIACRTYKISIRS